MATSLFGSTTIPVLEQVVNFAQARQAVLAGNIANMDTPGYKVRDLSVETFQQRLVEAIETRKTQNRPVSSSGIVDEPDDAMRRVRESIKSILYHDKSDVSIEQQVAEMNDNQLMHNLAIQIMNSQFRLLQSAVSERV